MKGPPADEAPDDAADLDEPPESLDLVEAQRRKWIEVETLASGLTGVGLEIRSKVARRLQLTASPATLLLPGLGSAVQTMVVVAPSTISLAPRGTGRVGLSVACTEMYKTIPQGPVKFTLGKHEGSDLLRLLAAPQFADLDSTTRQFAIWTLTDNPPWSRYPAIRHMMGPASLGLYRLTDEVRTHVAALFENAGIHPGRFRLFQGGGDKLRRKPTPPELLPRLVDQNPAVRAAVLEELLPYSDQPQVQRVLEACMADDGAVPYGSRWADGRLNDRGAPFTIGEAVAIEVRRRNPSAILLARQNPKPAVRRSAAGALGLGSASQIGELLPLLADPDTQVRATAAYGLGSLAATAHRAGQIEPSRLSAAILTVLNDPAPEVMHLALRSLARYPFPRPLPDEDRLVATARRIAHAEHNFDAVRFLEKLATPAAAAQLLELTLDDDADFRREVKYALSRMEVSRKLKQDVEASKRVPPKSRQATASGRSG